MKRPREFGCILVPDFPLQAWLRVEPESASRPVGILAESAGRLEVSWVSRAAQEAGVRPGMTLAQARSICSGLMARPVAAPWIRSAHEALLDLALGFSPSVQSFEPGLVVLDLAGTSGLYPSRPAMACALVAQARRMGFSACVGIAGGPRLALIAARAVALRQMQGATRDTPGRGAEGEVLLLRPGEEAAQLAPLPIEALGASPVLCEALHRLGLRTVGEFARLNRVGLGVRLGVEAYDLHRLACGEDDACIEPLRPSEVFEESVALDYALEQTEPLLFLVAAAVERLAQRLEARAMAPATLAITLELDPDGHHSVAVSLPSATSDVRSLMGLLRLQLEACRLQKPIRGFTLAAQGAAPPRVQGDLFGPAQAAPSELASLWARLAAIAGPDRVGCPVVPDTHGRSTPGVRAIPPPSTFREVKMVPRATLAFCRIHPPREVVVQTGAEGEPLFIQGQPFSGRVERSAGPWWIGTGWWTGRAEAGAFYDVEVRGRGLLRLFKEVATGRWFVDGWYG